MPETLLTPSSIKMFGRVVNSLTYTNDTADSVRGRNNFLHQQLSQPPITVSITGTTTAVAGSANRVTDVSYGDISKIGLGLQVSGGGIPAGSTITKIESHWDHTTHKMISSFEISNPATGGSVGAGKMLNVIQVTNFARIYAFSFEGSIYTMPKPMLYFVFGPGSPVDVTGFGQGRSNTDSSGVIAREWEFSAASGDLDLRYWEYEKGDFSMRLDIEAGPFEQILLAAALRAGADMADRSGANLGIRSGANLSGANLAGANLSGANLSGANLSGANLRGR